MFIPDSLVGTTEPISVMLDSDVPFFAALDAVVLVRVTDSQRSWIEGNRIEEGHSYLLFVDGSANGSLHQTSRHTAQMNLTDYGWMMTLRRKDMPVVVTDRQRYREDGLIPVDVLKVGEFTTMTTHSNGQQQEGRHRLEG